MLVGPVRASVRVESPALKRRAGQAEMTARYRTLLKPSRYRRGALPPLRQGAARRAPRGGLCRRPTALGQAAAHRAGHKIQGDGRHGMGMSDGSDTPDDYCGQPGATRDQRSKGTAP